MDINLKKFCKEYNGAYQCILPVCILGEIISDVANGTISARMAKDRIAAWLERIIAVGVRGNVPYALYAAKDNKMLMITPTHIHVYA